MKKQIVLALVLIIAGMRAEVMAGVTAEDLVLPSVDGYDLVSSEALTVGTDVGADAHRKVYLSRLILWDEFGPYRPMAASTAIIFSRQSEANKYFKGIRKGASDFDGFVGFMPLRLRRSRGMPVKGKGVAFRRRTGHLTTDSIVMQRHNAILIIDVGGRPNFDFALDLSRLMLARIP